MFRSCGPQRKWKPVSFNWWHFMFMIDQNSLLRIDQNFLFRIDQKKKSLYWCQWPARWYPQSSLMIHQSSSMWKWRNAFKGGPQVFWEIDFSSILKKFDFTFSRRSPSLLDKPAGCWVHWSNILDGNLSPWSLILDPWSSIGIYYLDLQYDSYWNIIIVAKFKLNHPYS